MEGGKNKKGKGKQPERVEKDDIFESEVEAMDEEQVDRNGGQCAELTAVDMEANIAIIRADLKSMVSEVKSELGIFRDSIRDDLKRELTDIREEIQHKLGEVASDLKATTERLCEAESRIADMEECSVDFKEALSQSLQAQERLQLKLTDLEARSRRNNVRIYGITEGAEENNIQQFIAKMIKEELQPLASVELGIQRCHRALGPKPPREAQPRSVVVYFQEFKTKELVLHSAWKKREIYYGERRIYFDHDYPAETLVKRKAYARIRRLLREKGIRFQTPPPAKLRVFFDSGPVTYESAAAAEEDLKKRGFSLERGSTAAPGFMEKTRKNTWQRAAKTASTMASTQASTQSHQERIKERLRSFQRP
ncbi:LINE-1 type transposase domain-containing protein 1 ES cell-associated protein 11 [Collichthys lucidus]|uniref:LINE-1 type transposase domain-containing protein 1 ES cell-associated protein 11 n=1 Tax=Collichthys lucidus TaxID=240159 RepID=A0A4U5TWZ9_COLLU|nr:LINE-1 type transposase domain-containing protein 1 ES cell-associated protein 11 [Collichthys lucidus]